MTPLFPRSGPGESSSPTSTVILRCYDFPTRIPGHLLVSLPGSTLPSSVRVSQLALTLPEGRRRPSGPGSMFSRRPVCRLDLAWTWAGSPRCPGDPSCAFASFQDPGRIDDPSPLTVSSMLPPLVRQRRLQRINHIGAIARLQHLLPTLQEWCCHHPCKARFRPAGSPLPGGSRTLWIALKGFRSHFHSPFLDLSWRYRDERSAFH